MSSARPTTAESRASTVIDHSKPTVDAQTQVIEKESYDGSDEVDPFLVQFDLDDPARPLVRLSFSYFIPNRYLTSVHRIGL